MDIIDKDYQEDREPINIFQARVYAVTDHLAFKQTFASRKQAMEHIDYLLNDERYGTTYSRWAIRTIDPILKAWIVYKTAENPKALKPGTSDDLIDKWKLTFYDMGDALFTSKTYYERPAMDYIKRMLVATNSFYCTLSIHEVGTVEERFMIEFIVMNKDFRLQVISDHDLEAQHKKELENQTQPLEEIYEHLYEEDRQESERINKEREELARKIKNNTDNDN